MFQFTGDPQRYVDALLRFGLPPHLFQVEQVANTQIELLTAGAGVREAYWAEEQWVTDGGIFEVWIEVFGFDAERNTFGVSSSLSADSPEYQEVVRILESRFGPGIFTVIPDSVPTVFEDI